MSHKVMVRPILYQRHVSTALSSPNLHSHTLQSTAQSRPFHSLSPTNHGKQSGSLVYGSWAPTTAYSGSILLIMIEPKLWNPQNNCAKSAWASRPNGTRITLAVRVCTQPKKKRTDQADQIRSEKNQLSVSSRTVLITT